MLFHNQGDLLVVLYMAVALLLALAVVCGVIAVLKHAQVKQFQDLLFKAERKIDTLERRMFDVLNAVPVALVETDNSGKFTFANKAAHQLLGRKDSELIGLRFHSATWGIAYQDGRMIPPDLMPISRTLRGQTVKGFQHMLTNHGSHDKVLVSVTSMPIVNRTGEVTGASAAMVELETEAGQGIDDLNGLWRGQWFAAATVPFWGLDAQGQILDVNNATLETFGLRREDALNKNFTQAFVIDADFSAAMDYLSDALDGEDHAHKSVTVTLKDRDGEERRSVITAWMARTHEGGERGLTVMAMPAAGSDAVAADSVPLPPPAAAVSLGDDDQQELIDLRTAEAARAALGVGVWQYDADADTIVEDEGMQRLIGREEPGGPTLISESGQAAADTAFARLMAGETDALDLDIEVIHKDGSVHWISLKGQATVTDGQRRIFGVAIDTTPWKAEIPVVEAAPVITGISEDDHATALDQARAEARAAALAEAANEHDAALKTALEGALAEAAAGHEVALTQAREQAAGEARTQALSERALLDQATLDAASDVYAWSTPVTVEPIVIREADPAVVSENEALKAKLADLQTTLDHALASAPDAEDLYAQIQTLKGDLEEAHIAAADLDSFRAHAATLQHELEQVRAAGAETDVLKAQLIALQAELGLAQTAAPQAAAEASALRAHLATIEAELVQLQAEHGDLSRELETLHNRPAPAPQIIEREVPVVQADPAVLAENDALRAQLQRTQSSLSQLTGDFERSETLRNELQIQLNEIFLTPQPVPDTAEHEARIAELESQLAGAHDDHAALQSQLSAADEARAQLEGQLMSATDAHAGLQAQLATAADARSQLEGQLSGLHAVHTRVETQLTNAGRTHAELESQLAEARDTQARLETQLAEAHTAHEHSEAALETVTARHGETQAALTDAAGRASDLQAAFDELKADRDALQAHYDELAAKPEPTPDYSQHDARIDTLQFELVKWQAAYNDALARLEAANETIKNTPPPAPTVDISALTSRLEQLQNTVDLSHEQQAVLQQRVAEMNAALAHAQRFETVGRLTTDVAADFAQMLNVINNALETMSRTPESPENVRRLSEAALAAGKRGERLTRQLQAFHTEDY